MPATEAWAEMACWLVSCALIPDRFRWSLGDGPLPTSLKRRAKVSAPRTRGPLEKLTSAQRGASNFCIKISYRYSVVTLACDCRHRNIVGTDNAIARSRDEVRKPALHLSDIVRKRVHPIIGWGISAGQQFARPY
jgi:hypothetical protein